MAELPQRIAITGAAGLLGTAEIARLTAAATVERIVAIDLLPTPVPPGLEGKVVSVSRDIREPVDDILSEHRIEAVVHLAYLLRPSRDPLAARRINVDATESLLNGCAAAGVRQIIYPSSTTVYGAHPGFVRPFTENDPTNPVRGFQYSEDKVAAERLLTTYADEHPETAVSILRVLRGRMRLGTWLKGGASRWPRVRWRRHWSTSTKRQTPARTTRKS